MTVRETPGLSAKGQPINVDVGLPQLVLGNSGGRAGLHFCNPLAEETCLAGLVAGSRALHYRDLSG